MNVSSLLIWIKIIYSPNQRDYLPEAVLIYYRITIPSPAVENEST